VRKAAADQIGEVLSAQPGDLENILRTVSNSTVTIDVETDGIFTVQELQIYITSSIHHS